MATPRVNIALAARPANAKADPAATAGNGHTAGLPFRKEASLEGITLFHEPWWLEAVAGDTLRQVRVEENGACLGFLPYTERSFLGVKSSGMPPFTHLLGPVVDVGSGSDTSRLHRRFNVTLELLNKLPKLSRVVFILDPSIPDALAFQAAGFRIGVHYTIRIDCSDLNAAWDGIRQKTRRFIRRAQEDYEIAVMDDPEAFYRFYMASHDYHSDTEIGTFKRLYEAARRNDAGQVLMALDQKKNVAAAIFIAWGHGILYYVLTARDDSNKDFGVVSLLIWHAMQMAHARNCVFDLDGIGSTGIFRFLSGFGGRTLARTFVARESRLIEAFRPLVLNLMMRRLPNFV